MANREPVCHTVIPAIVHVCLVHTRCVLGVLFFFSLKSMANREACVPYRDCSISARMLSTHVVYWVCATQRFQHLCTYVEHTCCVLGLLVF